MIIPKLLFVASRKKYFRSKVVEKPFLFKRFFLQLFIIIITCGEFSITYFSYFMMVYICYIFCISFFHGKKVAALIFMNMNFQRAFKVQ